MSAGRVAALLAGVAGLHGDLADAIGNPRQVWCRKCGRSEAVDAAHCFRHGWPLCCGETMTIDAPVAEPAAPAGGGEA